MRSFTFIAGLIVVVSWGALGCGASRTSTPNECGGSKALAGVPGQACDTGLWACSGPDSVQCTDCPGGMCKVPAGEFQMGCNRADCLTYAGPGGAESTNSYRLPYEAPRHQVATGAFEIDRTEVTVRDYQACSSCGAPAYADARCNSGIAGREDHPVNCVSWNQARQYCASVGKRLCSEAEWEKAARGTDGRAFPWGNAAATCDRAVFDAEGSTSGEYSLHLGPGGDGCGTGSTMPVGSKPAGASPYGVLDLAGNVEEWVADDWHRTYKDAPADGRAWCFDGTCAAAGTARAYSRVVRGGSYAFSAHYLRTSSRNWAWAETAIYEPYFVGFRCCR